tara:strand:+ start:56 stop:364 length:309 start_codon:yes stop_codon:yes gene_type:complete
MEITNILKILGVVIIVSFVLYFSYTIIVLTTKPTLKYVKGKCPDYWEYDSENNTCKDDSNTEITLDDYPTDCLKHSYSIKNNTTWNGISNNFHLSEVCISMD